MLIVMRGGPGAGKSTLARAIARSLRIPLIDKDDIKDIIDPAMAETKVAGMLAYECMWRVAERQLALGMSAIADSPLTGEMGYQRMATLRERYNMPVLVIHCACSDDTLWRERIEARQAIPDLPAHHTTHWPGIAALRAFDQPAHPWDPVLTLDTAAASKSLLSTALAFIEAHSRADRA